MRLVAGAAAVAVLSALALPGAAAAHGRGATIALDYRLHLDPAATALPGVHVRVLDGDRALEARVDDGVAAVRARAAADEQMIRIDDRGVCVNASSPTATADGLVPEGSAGWVRIRDGQSLAWHDHRLAPPPASEGRRGRALRDPGRGSTASRRRSAARSSAWRGRPSWPWLLGGLALAAGDLGGGAAAGRGAAG